MGNGQFGIYFVGSGATSDEANQTDGGANAPRDYERVLYKVGRFPYPPNSTVATHVESNCSPTPSTSASRKSATNAATRIRSKSVGAERNDKVVLYNGTRAFHSSTFNNNNNSMFERSRAALATSGYTSLNLNNNYDLAGKLNMGQRNGSYLNYNNFRLGNSKSSPTPIPFIDCDKRRTFSGAGKDINRNTDNNRIPSTSYINNSSSRNSSSSNANNANNGNSNNANNYNNGSDNNRQRSSITGENPAARISVGENMPEGGFMHPKASQTEPPPWMLYDASPTMDENKFMAVGRNSTSSSTPAQRDPLALIVPAPYDFMPPPPALISPTTPVPEPRLASNEWRYSAKRNSSESIPSTISEEPQKPAIATTSKKPPSSNDPRLRKPSVGNDQKPTVNGGKTHPKIENELKPPPTANSKKPPQKEEKQTEEDDIHHGHSPGLVGTVGVIRSEPPNPFGRPRIFSTGYPQLRPSSPGPSLDSSRKSPGSGNDNPLDSNRKASGGSGKDNPQDWTKKSPGNGDDNPQDSNRKASGGTGSGKDSPQDSTRKSSGSGNNNPTSPYAETGSKRISSSSNTGGAQGGGGGYQTFTNTNSPSSPYRQNYSNNDRRHASHEDVNKTARESQNQGRRPSQSNIPLLSTNLGLPKRNGADNKVSPSRTPAVRNLPPISETPSHKSWKHPWFSTSNMHRSEPSLPIPPKPPLKVKVSAPTPIPTASHNDKNTTSGNSGKSDQKGAKPGLKMRHPLTSAASNPAEVPLLMARKQSVQKLTNDVNRKNQSADGKSPSSITVTKARSMKQPKWRSTPELGLLPLTNPSTLSLKKLLQGQVTPITRSNTRMERESLLEDLEDRVIGMLNSRTQSHYVMHGHNSRSDLLQSVLKKPNDNNTRITNDGETFPRRNNDNNGAPPKRQRSIRFKGVPPTPPTPPE